MEHVPDDDLAGYEQIVARCPGADAQAELLPPVVVLGILGNLDESTPVPDNDVSRRLIDVLKETGLRRYSAGDADGALLLWETALDLDPEDLETRRYIDRASKIRP